LITPDRVWGYKYFSITGVRRFPVLIELFLKVRDQTFFEKVCVAPVDHADKAFLIKLFLKKFVVKLFFKKVVGQSFYYLTAF